MEAIRMLEEGVASAEEIDRQLQAIRVKHAIAPPA